MSTAQSPCVNTEMATLMSTAQTPPGHVSSGTPTVTFNPESFKCCVCYERKRTAFLMPCGHQYCMMCATQIEASSGICAFCRGAITAVGKLQD